MLLLMGAGCATADVTVQDVPPQTNGAGTEVATDDSTELMIEEVSGSINGIDSSDVTQGEPSHGPYLDYSIDEQGAQIALGQTVVLFFHAGWCPTCKRADREFLEETERIPEGVSVLKVDYDSSGDLRRAYGVKFQHTYVQIDASGEPVDIWIGGDLFEIEKRLGSG